MNDQTFNPFHMAQAQFDHVAELLDLDTGARALLRKPMREHACQLPVKMDDGTVEVFEGYRIHHNDARGPCKGGVRFHPQATIDTMRALSMWMTWKCAIVNLPLGGGNGGVVCDPHNLSRGEQQRLCRAWVRQLARDMGPLVDVPDLDMMTTPQHMLWMLDEYEALQGGRYPGFITGKPLGMGGSLGRAEAPGYGLIYTVREALKQLNMRLDGATASVQGFGSVGRHAIRLFEQLGGVVTCVATWDQQEQRAFSFSRKDGIDSKELLGITNHFGEINKDKAADFGYEVEANGAWLTKDVDILIPAAMENQITVENVDSISRGVKIIAEGSNGPTTPDADRVIYERDIFMIPDCLANAGGVTCSYFEQIQSNTNHFWEKDEVLGKLDVKVVSAFFDVSDIARVKKTPMRDAAQMLAVERVARSCRDRGWI